MSKKNFNLSLGANTFHLTCFSKQVNFNSHYLIPLVDVCNCIINVAQNGAHKGAHLEGQECSFVKKGTVAYIFRYIFAPDIFQLFTSYKMDYIFQQHQVSLLCIKSSAAHPAGYPRRFLISGPRPDGNFKLCTKGCQTLATH